MSHCEGCESLEDIKDYSLLMAGRRFVRWAVVDGFFFEFFATLKKSHVDSDQIDESIDRT